ncbi:related to PSY2-subunit of protein phosphatase PP4 complex [Sporisorium reilianum f. sp. reilianum]|uniref:Related to PSY2-subunit of protein phosphatase PP4 complex n=1 Tax=Sporisorium reilianum f. sp. reilianum TaxID=72559 RepID=A0A2N8U8Z0_9BASI|nr:related to PSY2-subunit of protein phosphatase PP4 complex [Sporisorium reilianum f. sp. reilianum]
MATEDARDASAHATSPPVTQVDAPITAHNGAASLEDQAPGASALADATPSQSTPSSDAPLEPTDIQVDVDPSIASAPLPVLPLAADAQIPPIASELPPHAFTTASLPDIPDEVLTLESDQYASTAAAPIDQVDPPADADMDADPAVDEYRAAITAPLPSMLNSNAIPLEEDASGDLSASSNEALTLTSTVSRGNYHQCGSARRVKVYELKGETWFDRGTGYCAGVYDETVDEALLVARREEKCQFLEGIDVPAEADADAAEPILAAAATGDEAAAAAAQKAPSTQPQPCQFVVVVSENLESEDILLASKVVKEEVYQRQQDTLVVWTEPTGVDMALSFQEAEGCNEVWEFLTEVQKHFMGLAEEALTDSPPTTPNPHSPTGVLGMSASDSGLEPLLNILGDYKSLPEPSLANLEKIDARLKDTIARGPMMREKLTTWLMQSHYIRKLVPFFHTVEELEALPSLHMLCTIMQTILLLNDSFLFEYILQDDVFLGVVGMLEYDPEFPRLKANYRDHLTQRARFKQVIDIGDPMIVAKIHQTYRLLYLRDVILARVVDDPTVSILNSFIFFHQNDIVNYCCQNDVFLGELFRMLMSPDESQERRSEGVLFLQQLCAMGKLIQLPARISLYRTLTDWGLLNVLQYALERLGQTARNAAAEILMTIIEYDANSVRAHVVSQVEQNARPLVSMMIDMLHNERDPGLKTQIAEAMRIIFDVAADGGPMATQAQVLSVQGLNKAKADPDRFLTWIYEAEISRLCSPFNTLPDFRVLSKGEKLPSQQRHRSALYGHLCDLLCHMIAHHSFRSQYFVLTSEITKKVGSLLHSREKFLRLSALRFFKYCLASNNQFTNRHFIKIELFSTILGLIEAEGDRNNLVASACLDFFEHMRRENMKTLISHCMDRHGARMRQLAEQPHTAPCFSLLVSQWEKNQEPLPQQDAGDSTSRSVDTDDKQRQQSQAGRGQTGIVAADAEEESYFQGDDGGGDKGAVPATSVGLVPYEDDDDDNEQGGEETSVAQVGPKRTITPDSSPTSSPGGQSPSSLTRVPEKRRRIEDDDDADDQLSRLSKRKPARTSKSKGKSSSQARSPPGDDNPSSSTQQSTQSSGGFIRSMANTISNTFSSEKRDNSRSPSPKRSKNARSDDTSPSAKKESGASSASKDAAAAAAAANAGKNGASSGGLGIKRISLGLTGSSKKMAAQSNVRSTDKSEDEDS